MQVKHLTITVTDENEKMPYEARFSLTAEEQSQLPLNDQGGPEFGEKEVLAVIVARANR